MPKRRPDHIVERTCAVCRSTHGKAEMRRVVRGADGIVAWDPSGRAAGRGAYVCADPSCQDLPRMTVAVARALDVPSSAVVALAEERHASA